MGSIKDRNVMDLTEAECIKNVWQEYTEELYKKDLHDPDNHDGVITHTHVEPDILESEVRWALGNITMNKARGGDGIPAELFQILNSNPKERRCQWMCKLPHNCTHLTSKVMLQILQARLQQYMNQALPDVQTGFRKGSFSLCLCSAKSWSLEIRLPTSVGS